MYIRTVNNVIMKMKLLTKNYVITKFSLKSNYIRNINKNTTSLISDFTPTFYSHNNWHQNLIMNMYVIL